MKHLKTMLRMFTVLAILALFTLPTFGAEDLNVYPTETTSGHFISNGSQLAGDSLLALVSSDPVPTYTTSDDGLYFIISYEGFSAMPYSDYQQTSIGYGNNYEAAKALFGDDCAPITEEQAFELLKSESVPVETHLNKYLTKNSITVNQNQFDALMSFTYNVGIGWLYGQNADGTPYKIQALLLSDPSTWTEELAQDAFGSWVKAGGVVLEGLVKRRAAEAKLFCTPYVGSDDTEEVPDDSVEAPDDTMDPVQPIVFSDVEEGDWYYDEVMNVCSLGIMNGMGDGTFCPDGTLTRAQMVQILANFDGATDLSRDANTGFSDVSSGMWYTGPIAWAVEKGYVNGYEDGTFRPSAPITREQMCAILARYLTDKGFAVAGEFTAFADDADISDYARESVYFCSALGLIQGVGENSFSPKTGATRAQAATVLLRMVDLG